VPLFLSFLCCGGWDIGLVEPLDALDDNVGDSDGARRKDVKDDEGEDKVEEREEEVRRDTEETRGDCIEVDNVLFVAMYRKSIR